MDDAWESPKEATPSVHKYACKDGLVRKGATAMTPPMTPKICNEANFSVYEHGLAQDIAATQLVDTESFTFWQLLGELARAHEREVQLARATTSGSVLANGQALTKKVSHNEGVLLDGVHEGTIPNLLHLARRSVTPVPSNLAVTPASAPQISFIPSILEPCKTFSLTPSSPHEAPSTVTIGKSDAEGSEENHKECPLQFPSESALQVLRISSHSTPNEQLLQQHFKDYRCIALARWLLRSEQFEFAIAVVILSNALVMFCECQYAGLDVGFDLQYPGCSERAQVVWRGGDTAFFVCDWLFGILFLLEMVMKLACFRIRYFLGSEKKPANSNFKFLRCCWNLQGYNVLDFLCVVAFLFDKIASSSSVINPQMFRLLRLFRLFRLVRLVRFLETLDHLYVMTTAISGLSKVLGWAVVLLTIMLLTCDLFLVQMLQVTYFNRVTVRSLTDDQLKKHHQMYAYFGTSTRCMLSMFEITLGNWPPVARLLSEEVSEWFTVICLLHKLTIGFSVIGVITGIILQETFKVAQTDDIIMVRAKKRAGNVLRQKMSCLFNTLDIDQDGKITLPEFRSIWKTAEIQTWLASLDIETDDLNTLFALIDEDCDGYITLDELCSRVPRIKGSARGIDVLAIMKRLSHDFAKCKEILQGAV